MTPAAHRVTTAQLGAAYPFVSEGGLGGRGVLIGRDLLGGSFTYDPFDLYAKGALTNPNMVVIGQIGRGKSSVAGTQWGMTHDNVEHPRRSTQRRAQR